MEPYRIEESNGLIDYEQSIVPNRIAPYVPYRTFKTFIEDTRHHGLPLRFDASALQRFSGTVRTQLLSALRFLDLVGDSNEPREKLKSLYEATGLEYWRSMLREVLDDAYAPIMRLNLAQITPTHLNQEFREQYKAKDQVVQKQVTFFVHAAKDAGIELSGRVLKRTRTRTARRGAGPSQRKAGSGAARELQEKSRKDDLERERILLEMTRTPIALGKDRLAYILLPADWDSEQELGKLLKLLRLSLA